jgi:histidyl-tRNA synthetase
VAIGFMFEEQRRAAVALAVRLRGEGRAVDLALAPQKPKAFFSRAGAGTCSHAILIGPDDVAAGRAGIKNLSTRESIEIAL